MRFFPSCYSQNHLLPSLFPIWRSSLVWAGHAENALKTQRSKQHEVFIVWIGLEVTLKIVYFEAHSAGRGPSCRPGSTQSLSRPGLECLHIVALLVSAQVSPLSDILFLFVSMQPFACPKYYWPQGQQNGGFRRTLYFSVLVTASCT